MRPTTHAFPENARRALADERLQKVLATATTGFVEKRRQAAERLPEFEALRDQGRDLKNHVLANLDVYLEAFESRVVEQGGHVHWCRTDQEARDAILAVCRKAGARTVTKGKSMIAEEIGINDHLEANGLIPIETDLGEYIIQLRQEPPSHIIAPAIHLSKEDVAETFRAAHPELPPGRPMDDAKTLITEARHVLRRKFQEAEVGITGANLMIAETGSTVIVTNEGNGDLTQILPRIHIVIATIDKVVPTLEDATLMLRLLARSATGQEASAYTTVSTGPRRPGDADGPEEFHVVLLDNGRSALLGTEFQDVLRCIRCGACMNHCPVYTKVGGHAFEAPYPGPIGSILMPQMEGLGRRGELPHACTMCNACVEICPVRIPIVEIMGRLRAEAVHPGTAVKEAGARASRAEALVWKGWATAYASPLAYRFATALLARLGNAAPASLPLLRDWTNVRSKPRFAGRTLHELAREKGIPDV